MTAKSAVYDRITGNQKDLVDFLTDLISRKSLPGHERQAQELIYDRFKSMSLDIDMWEPDVSEFRNHEAYFDTLTFKEHGYEDRPNIVGKWEGTGNGSSLVLSGHVDVVSPEPVSDWSYDPWNATVEDGRIYGRGSADMKGGIAAMSHAVESLMDLGYRPEGDVFLQTTIDEEAGGTGGVLSALERGYQPDAAIIPEPTGVPNVGVASAGVMYFKINVPGKAAHAARGFEGVSAAEKAAHIQIALADLDSDRKERTSYAPAEREAPEAEGSVTNLNVGIVRSGDWPSTVPGEAELQCRVGWPPGETREEVQKEIEETIQEVVQSDEWLSENPPEVDWFGWYANPHEVDRNAEILSIASQNVEQVTGSSPVYTGGLAGLDERFYNRYYDIPAPTVGPRGHNYHGADEYVEIDSLLEVSQVLAGSIIDWCGVEEVK